jgi:F-box and leucine-rich repeat protein GRR1
MIRVLAKADQTFTYARFIRRLNFLFLGKDLSNTLFCRLSQCVRLERLTLVNCSSISDDALTYVFISCPNLLAIDLTGVTETTDRAITALALTCKRLQGINLGGCKDITEKGIFALATNCPLLRRVKLSGIEAITDAAVSALAKSCPLLLEIDLNGCKNITDVSVRDLWTYSLHVREMRLAHCAELTDSAFPAVVKGALPASKVNPFPTSGTTEYPADTLPPLVLSHPFDHLRMLDLTSCSKLTDEAIEGIISSSPKIRNLVLAIYTICIWVIPST